MQEFELYRYGGEEFVILSRLPDSLTLELFQHVMNDVRMHFIVEGNPVTISAGIASFCKDYNRTLKIADENLYLAKTDGRNKIYMNGDEIKALNDISFKVESGEILGILGRSGSG